MPKKQPNNTKKNKVILDDLLKTRLHLHGKMLFNIILISILLIGSIFMFSMASTINVENRKKIISYEEKSDIKYRVGLKNNRFYQGNSLGMDLQYPAGVIDKIYINYSYHFKTNKKSDYRYRYFTNATVIVNNKNTTIGNNNKLLSRDYQLDNQATGKQVGKKSYDLEKEYVIDYDYYNNFVNSYKNNYGLTIDSYLNVSMYVEVIDNYDDTVINTSKTMNVNIPLASNPINITKENKPDKSDTIYEENDFVTISAFFIIFALVMLISGVLLFVQEIIKVVKNEEAQSKYINKINKIISANSDVIIKVKNKINLKDHNIIEVETIEELLDAQNELRIPIAYYETKANEEGYFVIVNGKEVWRYIFRIEKDK